jgi:CubicO group peptidase (beta-lactamase class C family)
MRIRLVLRLAALVLSLWLIARVVGAPFARPALGFVAKVTCSQVFVGGLAPAAAIAELPDEPLAKLVRTTVDTSGGRVRASIPGIAVRTARHHPGLGCTLLPLKGELTIFPPQPRTPPLTAAHAQLPWPDGERVLRDIPEELSATQLRSALARAFAEPDRAAARTTRAVIVVYRGQIVAERYAPGFGPETRFPGWSMTKSVGSALVGTLVAQGRLHLDASGLFPEWLGDDDARRVITLRHLLWMSDGLAHDESYTPTGGATRLLFASDDIAATAAATPLRRAPGTVWYYASAASNLAARVMRDSVGGALADYLTYPRRALFDRIGMRSAVMEPDATGLFVASSFMYATARDWARFGLLYLRDGVWDGERILPEGWVRFSATPAPAAPLGEYGAGWWLNAGAADDSTRRPFPRLPRDLYRAAGFEGQTVAIVPSADLVVVRLGLSRPDTAFDLTELMTDVLEALPPRNAR